MKAPPFPLSSREPVTFSIFSRFLHPTRCFKFPPKRRHPERSASQIYRITEDLWRGVEGPRGFLSYPCCLKLLDDEARALRTRTVIFEDRRRGTGPMEGTRF